MGRARVILADTDEGYVHSLQIRFAGEFFDRIDLEVITDIDYFAELLEMPQQAEVLVVEERMYDPSLRRHSIASIFVLESDRETGTEEAALPAPAPGTHSQVTRIYKYTSIPEVFSQIVGVSGLGAASVVSGKAQILLVTAASGGVGKTSVAMGLSICLSRNYKKVLYIGAHHLQTFHYLLDNPESIARQTVYGSLASGRGGGYPAVREAIRQEEFYYLPPFKSSLLSLGLPYSVYREIAVSARESGEFDFIVVDAENILDEHQLSLTEAADHVIVVMNQSERSVYATGLYVRNVGGTGTDRYLFLCNAYRSGEPNAMNDPEMPIPFRVDEYIPMFEGKEEISGRRIAQDDSMRRVVYRLI